jgi:hypothetical protein
MNGSFDARVRWASVALGLVVLVSGCGSNVATGDGAADVADSVAMSASGDEAGHATTDAAVDACTVSAPPATLIQPDEPCPNDLACGAPGGACYQLVDCCGIKNVGSYFYCDCSGRYRVYMNIDPAACLSGCPDGAQDYDGLTRFE